MIEMRLLELITVFKEQKTLSKTAEVLHVSQPALSRSLKSLEESLGIALFDRTGHNRLVLNENGLLLADYAARILDLEQEMETALKNQAETLDHLRVASCAPAPLWRLEDLIAEHFEAVVLENQITVSDQAALKRLMDHQADLAIVHEIPPFLQDLEHFDWLEEELSLAVPKDHPLSLRQVLSVEDLKGQSLVMFDTIGFWNAWTDDNLKDAHILRASEWNAFSQAILTVAFPYFTSNLFSADQDEKVVRIPFKPPVKTRYRIVYDRNRRRQLEPLLNLIQENSEAGPFFLMTENRR